MTGSFITISVEDAAARAMLNKLGKMDTTPLMIHLGERMQAWTQDRFDANQQQAPDGTPWAKLNPEYAQNKPRHLQNQKMTLNAYLRRSIYWDLLDSQSVLVGTNVKYAAIHQFGGKTKPHTILPRRAKALSFGGRILKSVKHPGSNIPARPYLGISAQESQEIREIIRDWVVNQSG